MQNRKRPVGIVRFATPDNRKPHTQVKTHRLRILFIDIDRIGSLAGDGPLHQLASAASAPVFGPDEQHGDMTSVQTDERHDTPRIPQAAKFDRRQVADRQQRTQFPNIRLGEKIMGSPHGSLSHLGQLFEIVRSDLYNAHLSMIKIYPTIAYSRHWPRL